MQQAAGICPERKSGLCPLLIGCIVPCTRSDGGRAKVFVWEQSGSVAVIHLWQARIQRRGLHERGFPS
jgi:hypothetical protein